MREAQRLSDFKAHAFQHLSVLLSVSLLGIPVTKGVFLFHNLVSLLRNDTQNIFFFLPSVLTSLSCSLPILIPCPFPSSFSSLLLFFFFVYVRPFRPSLSPSFTFWFLCSFLPFSLLSLPPLSLFFHPFSSSLPPFLLPSVCPSRPPHPPLGFSHCLSCYLAVLSQKLA